MSAFISITPGDITGVTAGTGLTGGGTSGAVTLSADVGTTANKLVQLNGSAQLPAVDGSLLTGISGGGGVTSVNGATGAITLLPADTGWTAPASVGDKTVGTPIYTGGGTAGSDTVDIGKINQMDDQIFYLTKTLQALQTALANNLRPNA